MDPVDAYDAYKILDQIRAAMATTAFALLLYFCIDMAKKSINVADWLGFYAVGVLTTGYGLGLGIYTGYLLWETAGTGTVGFNLATVMPPVLVILNGAFLLPIARFVVERVR